MNLRKMNSGAVVGVEKEKSPAISGRAFSRYVIKQIIC